MKTKIAHKKPQGIKDHRIEYYWAKVNDFGRKYKNFDWPAVQVLLNYIFAYDIIWSHFSKTMRPFGLSPAVFNILMILSRNEKNGIKQYDISKLLLVSRANITGLVNSLARKGYVRRMPDKTDARAWLVGITKKGEALIEAYLPVHYAEVYKIFSDFSSSEKRLLNALITKLRDGIE